MRIDLNSVVFNPGIPPKVLDSVQARIKTGPPFQASQADAIVREGKGPKPRKLVAIDASTVRREGNDYPARHGIARSGETRPVSMRLRRTFLLCTVTAVSWSMSRSQDQRFDVCGVTALAAAAPSAQTLVEQILRQLVQRPDTILVFASTDPRMEERSGAASAECSMGGGVQRWIVYDAEVIPEGPGLDFALAHETAHHMNRHLLNGDTRTKQQELEADRYGARYLTMLGWDEKQLLEALEGLKLPLEAKGRYPSLEERKAAVIAGYKEGAGPPLSDKVAQPAAASLTIPAAVMRDDLSFQVRGCVLKATTLRCTFGITNKASSTRRVWFTEAFFVDDQGRQYNRLGLEFASKTEWMAHTTDLIPEVPVNLTLEVANFPNSASVVNAQISYGAQAYEGRYLAPTAAFGKVNLTKIPVTH
jgi:hypothetical protein